MTFTEKLKKEKTRLNLTQAELAHALDVSPRAVWQWLNDKPPSKVAQEGAITRLRKLPQKA